MYIIFREPTSRFDPPETSSFNNGIYIVFDINHSVNIKLLYLREGVSGGSERDVGSPDPELFYEFTYHRFL